MVCRIDPLRVIILGLVLLLPLSHPVHAHSGAVAIAVPVEGIVMDGDLSDWPEGMRRYAIELPEHGDRPKNEEDFRGSFRIGYNKQEKALYIAVEVQDESVVIDTTTTWWNTQDGCEVYVDVEHKEQDSPAEKYVIFGTFRSKGKYELEVKRTGSLHQYEWRIDIGGMKEKMSLGMDVVVEDKDEDGSFSWMAWGSGTSKDSFTGRRGDVVLVEKETGIGKIQGKIKWEDVEKGTVLGKVRIQSLTSTEAWIQTTPDPYGEYAVELPADKYRVEAGYWRRKEGGDVVEVPASRTAWVDEIFVPVVPRPPLGKEVKAGAGRTVAAGAGYRHGFWQTLDVADGLASNSVSSLLEDQAGQLWFGTGGGVSRYDGERFVTYTTQDGLAHNGVQCLLEDQTGQLWIGTQGGVSRYDGERFVTYTYQDGLAHNHVVSLLMDRTGQLWIGTQGGVSRYDGERFVTYTTQDGLLDDWVVSLLEDRAGQLWFGTSSGVSRYDGERFVTYTTQDDLLKNIEPPQMPINTVQCLLEDRSGQLWFGTQGGGVSRYDGERFVTYTTQDGLAHNGVQCLLEDRSGQLWFGTRSGGVSRYDGAHFVTYSTQDGLPNDRVESLLEDRTGRLWISTQDGVSRYDGERFVTYTYQDGLPNIVRCFLEDRSGQLWFGTQGGGVSRYDGERFVTYSRMRNKIVRCFLEDRSGQLWFGTQGGGVSRYDGERFVTYTTQDGLLHNWVESLLEDRSGQLWIGTRGGVSRYDGERFVTYTTQDGLAHDVVLSLLEDRSGQLWFGTQGGVSWYDGERFVTYSRKDGLLHNWVLSLLEDRTGQLWIRTYGGMSRYDGAQFVTYSRKDGLPSNGVECLLEDQEGRLWFGTQSGVSRWDGFVSQTLLRRDGLISNEIQCILQDRQGDIWLATSEGLVCYRPPSTPPLVHLRKVIADRDYGPVEEIRIPSSQKLITFEFLGISYQTRANQMVYVYQLEGYDTDWRQTREHQVSYTDLPQGEYVFQVKAVDRDLNYSEAAMVQVDVYYQPVAAPFQLSDLQLADLFVSFYPTYTRYPLGSVQVHNHTSDSLTATLRFYIPEIMRRPVEQGLSLASQSAQHMALRARLDPAVLRREGAVPVAAEVALEVAAGEQLFSIKEKQDIILYGRGALRWDTVARAAAFVTSSDPHVAGFARPLLVAFEAEISHLGRPFRNLLQAMVLFEALKQHGVRYLADPNTPYARMATDHSVVDHIQYPAQVLQGKAGDCDDLTALYASLLENAGIATALVDYPGHLFLLFDSGVARRMLHQLPVEKALYVLRDDRVWIPVEVTRVGASFVEAWRAGAGELERLSERDRRRLVVETAVAWTQYPATPPVFDGEGVFPEKGPVEGAVATQQALLQEMIDAYIEQTYLDPLKVDPAADRLRTQVLKVYLAIDQYDTAIETGLTHLLDKQGDKATTLNHLGIAYSLKGEMPQAAYHFQQALDLRPADRGIQDNLDRALRALGRGSAPVPSVEVQAGVGAKGRAVEGDAESFYWIE